MIQRIHLLALMSAPIFHDTKSGYLLVKLNSQVDDQDSTQYPLEPLFPEITEMLMSSQPPQGLRSGTYVHNFYDIISYH